MIKGSLAEVIRGADAVIGVSGPGSITPEMVSSMADKSIVFAMANPVPEILPDEAKKAGAYIVATGRSDYPNQINNVLAFPGIFKAVVKGRLTRITPHMKLAAAKAIEERVASPTRDMVIPSVFDEGLASAVSDAILATVQSEQSQ